MTTTRLLSVCDPQALPEALAALRRGDLVVMPTDTVYGVGCNAWDADAVARLYAAKERPRHMPIPILVSSREAVALVARSLPEGFEALESALWPGALTLIASKQPDLPEIVCAGGETVAVRMPADDTALALIRAAGGALAVTSANRSGQPAALAAADALRDLDGRVSIILNGGPCPGGVASTIVDLTSDPPRLLRAGPLSLAELQRYLPGLAK